MLSKSVWKKLFVNWNRPVSGIIPKMLRRWDENVQSWKPLFIA
jgi:hypothetical protein